MSLPGRSGRVVCLGEALVDLVCEQAAASIREAPEFVPRLGGSLANIAVAAARFGAEAQLLGGAGHDDWGRWLRERISAEGVDVSRFVLAPQGATSLAFVTVSAEGEPAFAFYEGADRPAANAGPDLDPALGGEPGALVLGSDTLLTVAERAVTLRATDLARERGWSVLADPNLRPARWPNEATMHEAVGTLVERASVVKCNVGEARELTGQEGDEAAARALIGRGPEAVVVTRGGRGALLVTSEAAVEVPAPAADRILDATGAGDCVSGVLAAALAAGAPAAGLEPALSVAMEAAGRVVGEWGASAGLPAAAEARAALEAAL